LKNLLLVHRKSRPKDVKAWCDLSLVSRDKVPNGWL
jgi:hypothetical protein